MLKLPEMPGKHHMIGYKPKISEDSKRYVHHMMLYECHDEVNCFGHLHYGPFLIKKYYEFLTLYMRTMEWTPRFTQ